MASNSPTNPDSTLYRRVWRWHFYAGLICLPFLAMMAATGALYLFKNEIEAEVYRDLLFAPVTQAPLDAETLTGQAVRAHPGQVTRFTGPVTAGRSAEVGVRTVEGQSLSVFVDAGTGRVLGALRDEARLMEVVKSLHSLAIAGSVANHWIEIVAGWAIVLVVSGVFLWWPRGRGGVYSVRGRPAQRTWWRDLHAVTGITAAAVILFLAVTGMPWSAFWGEQFGRLTNQWGIGLPKYLFGPAPSSTPTLSSLGTVPWTLTQAPMPQSAAHADHRHLAPSTPAAGASTPSIGLNDALRIFADLGLSAGTTVDLPSGPQGVYTARQFPDDVRAQRVVHLDQYSGAVLADVGYADYGVAGRLVEWGVSLHTGVQFGRINQLVMLAGCFAIVALSVSALVMWWKRRPQGRLAAPPRRPDDRAAHAAVAIAALLGLLYPLVGASMLVALLIDFVVPSRWHERFGL